MFDYNNPYFGGYGQPMQPVNGGNNFARYGQPVQTNNNGFAAAIRIIILRRIRMYCAAVW